MVKIAAYNLTKHLKSYLSLMAELALLLVVLFVVLSELFPMLYMNRLFDRFQLSKGICVTAYMDEESMAALASDLGVTCLWQNLSYSLLDEFSSSGDGLIAHWVAPGYFERFHYSYASKMDEYPEGNMAIIPSSLSDRYKTGETYSVSSMDGEVFTFTVYAVLKNDYMFVPPTESNTEFTITEDSLRILIAPGTKNKDQIATAYSFFLEAEDPSAVDTAISALYENKNVVIAVGYDELQDEQNAATVRNMGLPIILAAASTVLALAAMLANVLLKASLNEYNNGIYYLLGFTWKKCMCIQLTADFIVYVASLVVSMAAILFLVNLEFHLSYFAICAAYVLLICLIAEIPGILRMRKKNVAEIIDLRE